MDYTVYSYGYTVANQQRSSREYSFFGEGAQGSIFPLVPLPATSPLVIDNL